MMNNSDFCLQICSYPDKNQFMQQHIQCHQVNHSQVFRSAQTLFMHCYVSGGML